MYKILLHKHTVNDAAERLVKITRLSIDAALRVVAESHSHGMSLITITHKELAELYQEQLNDLGISTSIEPAERK